MKKGNKMPNTTSRQKNEWRLANLKLLEGDVSYYLAYKKKWLG